MEYLLIPFKDLMNSYLIFIDGKSRIDRTHVSIICI